MSEIKSAKFSHNKSFVECLQIITPVVFESMLEKSPGVQGKEFLDVIISTLNAWKTVYQEFLIDDDAKREFLSIIQLIADKHERLGLFIHIIYQALYKEELV